MFWTLDAAMEEQSIAGKGKHSTAQSSGVCSGASSPNPSDAGRCIRRPKSTRIRATSARAYMSMVCMMCLEHSRKGNLTSP